MPRLAAVGVVALALAGGALADHLVGRGGVASAPVASLAADAVPPPEASSSAWFCTGGTSASGGATATVTMTNTTDRPVRGRLVAYPGGVPLQVTVPARGELSVEPAGMVRADRVAAAVLLQGGGVAVTQTVSGPLGWSVAPCASSASPRWYFAHGSTAAGSSLELSLFNPTATDAVVDVSLFTSTEGTVAPPAYQGLDVPPGSLATLHLADHVQNDPAVAASVTALTGALVASELQQVGQPPHAGLALSLGAPSTAVRWSFAQSTDVTGGVVAYHVFNPTAVPAAVTMAIGLQQASAEPLPVAVPAGAAVTIVAEQQTRIPMDTPYAVTFRSAAGVGIVVDRQVEAPAGAPAPAVGHTPAVPDGARAWLVPSTPSAGSPWSLAIADLAGSPVRVTVRTLSGDPVAGFTRRTVAPEEPLFVPAPVPAPWGTLPLVVRADGPVAVEFDAVPAGAPGVVVVPSLPLAAAS